MSQPKKISTLVLIRHGQSQWNKENLFTGWKDPDLTEKGIEEAINAGQKLIFWVVIILGTSVSASGLSLLFPFEFPMFAATFAKLNSIGITGLLGMDPLPTNLLPHEEMQLSQIWHSIVAFIMMAVIIAHIYIGSVGMVGAYDAMGSGQVDVNWAKQHHDLWEEEVSNQKPSKDNKVITPAE